MNLTNQLKLMWKLCIICVMAITLTSVAPLQNSYANNSSTAITDTLCRITNELTGGIGKAISIIIVISLAIALFLGKVTWGVAIAVAVGMGILFGAKGVVDLVAGGGAQPCG